MWERSGLKLFSVIYLLLVTSCIAVSENIFGAVSVVKEEKIECETQFYDYKTRVVFVFHRTDSQHTTVTCPADKINPCLPKIFKWKNGGEKFSEKKQVQDGWVEIKFFSSTTEKAVIVYTCE